MQACALTILISLLTVPLQQQEGRSVTAEQHTEPV